MKLSLKNIYYANPVDLVREHYKISKYSGLIIFEKKENSKENAGDAYENAIKRLLLKSKVGGPATKKKSNRNRWASDADMNVYGELLNIEVKASPKALLGSLSARFDLENGLTSLTKEDVLDKDVITIIKNAIEENSGKIANLIKFMKNADPNMDAKFPTVMSRAAYEQNRKEITKLYITAKYPMSVVHDLYAGKGVYYMQLGEGAGLFYLAQKHNFMPDDLPQLGGEVEVQIRPKPGTSPNPELQKFSLSIDFKMRFPAGSAKSPYTIDSPEGIEHLMQTIEAKKSNK